MRTQLETAKPGDVIVIPEGTHAMTRSLVLSASGVTIKGAGMDKTMLSFKGQVAGAEGLLVNASDFTIEDLAIEDTKATRSRSTKAQHRDPPRARRVDRRSRTRRNGAYGLYPVQLQDV